MPTRRDRFADPPDVLRSVSKMFTAVAIAKRVERNQLSFESTLASPFVGLA